MPILSVTHWMRLVLDAQLQAAHVGAPHDLRQALDEEREADRRHEQRDLRLVDERAQDDALDHEAQHDHDGERGRQREPRGRPVLQQADEGKRGEEHHRALREVEDAGRLVDQHEAQRDQRVHDAGKQAADQHFEEEGPVEVPSMRHAEIRVDDRLDRRGPRPAGRRRSSCRSPARRRGRRCPSPRPCRARSGRSSCRIVR